MTNQNRENTQPGDVLGVDPQQATQQAQQPSPQQAQRVQQPQGQPMQQGDVIGAVPGQPAGNGNGPVKDPEDWVTGDEPMTDAQRAYLDSLAKAAGETLPGSLTKAQASEHIDRLQVATGRGTQSNAAQEQGRRDSLPER